MLLLVATNCWYDCHLQTDKAGSWAPQAQNALEVSRNSRGQHLYPLLVAALSLLFEVETVLEVCAEQMSMPQNRVRYPTMLLCILHRLVVLLRGYSPHVRFRTTALTSI